MKGPILIVDDDKLVAKATRRVVGGVCVSSIEEGLQMAAECRPVVIVLDVYFNGSPSFDEIPKFRAAAPGAQILMMSGYPTDEDCERAFRSGARAYVDKLDIGELHRLVRAAL